jgi:hypothetical protein
MLTAANAAAQKTLLSLVKGDVGLGNVDNTSDGNKPISTAQQAAIDAKIGGTVGTTDNRLVRSDGTGARTLQSTGITVDDSNNVSGIGTISTGVATLNTVTIRADSGFASISPNAGRQFLLATNHVQLWRNGTFTLILDWGTADTLRIMDSGSGFCDLQARAITASALMCVGVYTFATVPSASSNTGKFLRISDRAQKHAYSDGTSWRFFGDDAVIS